MKNLIYLFFLCLSTSIYAQEICGDGIDNDGDYLIDCADVNCNSETACLNTIPCQDSSIFYQVLNGSSFNIYNPNTLTYTLIANNPYQINAIGYNVQDGFIYGIRFDNNNNTNNNHLVKVGADGVFMDLGDVSNLPISEGYYTGDFDLEGNLYILRGNTTDMYKIDVDNLSATYIPLSSVFDAADFSFLPSKGKLYGLEDGTSNLLSVKPTNGTVENLGGLTPALPNCGGYGASFADKDGFLYYFCNASGNLFKIDPSTMTSALLQATGINLQTNDGASCALSNSLTICEAEITPDFCLEVENNNVAFTNNSTGVGSLEYLWEFGDGTSFVGKNPPTKSYPTNAATYEVCLTVRSDDGICCFTCCKEIKVFPPCFDNIPGPAFNYLYKNNGSIKFNNPAGSGNAFTKEWTIDGVFHSDANQPPSKTLSPGVHTVCLEVTKNSNPNCSEKFCRDILVNDPCIVPPSAKFIYETCLNSKTVDFRSIATEVNSSTVYHWDFGDGNTGTGIEASHTYPFGTYMVCLEIVNAGNCTKKVCGVIEIEETICSDECSSGGSNQGRFSQTQVIDEENKSEELLIMPNPSRHATTIFFANAREEKTQISVIDLNGKVIQQHSLPKGNRSYELNTSDLAPAMYIINLRYDNGKVVTSKMIKI